MQSTILGQFFTLSIYALFMGFCFCDGFNLPTVRKLIWFVLFLLFSAQSLRIKNELDLVFILPVPTLLAIILCSYQRIKAKRENK
jgi:hypothetical protein